MSEQSAAELTDISREVLDLIPVSIVRKNKVVPVALENQTLVVATAEMENGIDKSELEFITGHKILLQQLPKEKIEEFIQKHYSGAQIYSPSPATLKTEKPQPAETRKSVYTTEAHTLESEVSAPAIKWVDNIFKKAVELEASDIHIEPYEKITRVRLRIDGILQEQDPVPEEIRNAVISRIKVMADLDIAERRMPQDGRTKIKMEGQASLLSPLRNQHAATGGGQEIDIRVSVIPSIFGEKVALRILDSSSMHLDLNKLGFEHEQLELYLKNIKAPNGIILVTGPTGSGKTTTLYSTLTLLNTPEKQILTIEDPVEYILPGINQVQARAEIGLTFAAGLRTFLRQDPNIIMVGEIRDQETAEIAISASLTGHLVFSTLHTNDSVGAVTRLINMGIEPYLISSTLTMVVAQRLVRIICENCKEEYLTDSAAIEKLIGQIPQESKKQKQIKLYRGKGCNKCSQTGYKGRLAIYEILEITDPLREQILQKASSHALRQTAKKQGLLSLRDAGIQKVLASTTTLDELVRITLDDTP